MARTFLTIGCPLVLSIITTEKYHLNRRIELKYVFTHRWDNTALVDMLATCFQF